MISIVTGVLLGFVTSAMRSNDSREDLVRNMLLGIGGAYVGTWLAGSFFESANTGSLSFSLVSTAVLVSALVLFVTNSMRRT